MIRKSIEIKKKLLTKPIELQFLEEKMEETELPAVKIVYDVFSQHCRRWAMEKNCLGHLAISNPARLKEEINNLIDKHTNNK